MNKRNLPGVISLAVILITGFFAWQNRFEIYDWVKLRNYQPTAQISEIATASGMNDTGRKLFYINDPRISDRQEFQTECSNDKEQTFVLGCYTGTNIYIFDVTDDRLKGVEEVTAAHEMLHAAYDRLSPGEKRKIDDLTQQAFDRVNNPRISSLIESYRKADPSVVPNELHSILGTEVANLGPELEAYYTKYFTDRNKVLSASQAYEKVINDNKNKVEQYDADLSLRKSEINSLQANLDNQYTQLEILKKQMDQYLKSGQNSQYNSLVSKYNRQVETYNAQLVNYKNLLEEYNQLVVVRNNVAVEQQGLVESLDSRVKAIQ